MIQKGIKLYIIVEGWPKFQLILITATLSKIKINIWIIFSETDYCKTLLQFCLSRREREKLVSVWATHKIMCEWIWSQEVLLLIESTNFYGMLNVKLFHRRGGFFRTSFSLNLVNMQALDSFHKFRINPMLEGRFKSELDDPFPNP